MQDQTPILTKLTPVDIQYLALWISGAVALSAAIGSIVVAIVKAVADRSHAKAVARRQYRLDLLTPVLAYAESIVAGHERAYYSIRSDAKKWQEAVEASNVKAGHLVGIGLIMRHPKLKPKWQELKKQIDGFGAAIGEVDVVRARRENLSAVEERFAEQMKPLRQAVIDLRAAAEDFIF